MASPESPRIDAQVEAFLILESLGDTAGYSKTQERLAAEAGLDELPGVVILRMRTELISYRNELREQARGR